MKKKILIVEDDKVLLQVIKLKLEKEGYAVEKAENAGEALRVIGEKKVDLIISDIMMPNISGLSLLNMIREFFMVKVPVILMSALNKADIVNSAMESGAYAFIGKPIDFNKLCLKINLLFSRYKTSNIT